MKNLCHLYLYVVVQVGSL